MNNPLLMRRSEATRGLDSVINRFAARQRAVQEFLTQRAAFKQLCHQIWHSLMCTHLVDGDDVRMIEGCGGPCLLLKTPQTLRIMRGVSGYDLDGDVAFELRVVRAVHLAHAAGAERGKDLVGTEFRARGQRHTRVIIVMPGTADVYC